MSERASVLQTFSIDKRVQGVCGVDWQPSTHVVASIDPTTEQVLSEVEVADQVAYDKVVQDAYNAAQKWRSTPAPQRGELVRRLGQALRENKKALGALVSMEMGKIRSEGEGEVQEMIDICDFACGLSRQLYGSSMHSERPEHRMYEQWHPMGVVGVISAFNFPVAVWSWNAAIALVCGNSVVWKPSEHTPLVAVVVQRIVERVIKDCGAPEGLCGLVCGGADIGEAMALDPRVPVVSATGSTAMGRKVSVNVASRFGRCILELGGNNALTVLDDADLSLALRATLFGAVGTAGQRCTTTRRLVVAKSIADKFVADLISAYAKVNIGDPLDSSILMGPLIHANSVEQMQKAIERAKSEGGVVLCGAESIQRSGYFVKPTIIKAHRDMPIVAEETFAPILYVIEHEGIDDAIAINNSVSQGLSSSVFTQGLLAADRFLSSLGSDCGIANVNIGTSGAEIGGAFGGEKETGGGREAGSDSWKAYMRRQTCTINYGKELPLAQGVTFST